MRVGRAVERRRRPAPATSSGSCSSVPIAGSARKPIARLVIVMPSWAPLSWVDSDAQRDQRALRRRVSPAAAARSIVGAVDGHEGELGGDEHAAARASGATTWPAAAIRSSVARAPRIGTGRGHGAATVPLGVQHHRAGARRADVPVPVHRLWRALEVQQSFTDDALTVVPRPAAVSCARSSTPSASSSRARASTATTAGRPPARHRDPPRRARPRPPRRRPRADRRAPAPPEPAPPRWLWTNHVPGADRA